MSDRKISISRTIAASPEAIFALLTDPAQHGQFDGSGTVQSTNGGESRLVLGSKFGMSMKLGPLPYRITNTVVEFEPDRRIAWRHFGGHRWRYLLEPLEGGTKVTEEFDWSTARSPKSIERMGYPERHVGNIERTLERLAALVEKT